MYSEGETSTRCCGACQNCILNGHNHSLKDSQPLSTGTRASAAIVSPDLFSNVVCETLFLSESMPLDLVSIFQMSGATVGKSNRLRISASAPVSMPVRPTCAHTAVNYTQDSNTLYTILACQQHAYAQPCSERFALQSLQLDGSRCHALAQHEACCSTGALL